MAKYAFLIGLFLVTGFVRAQDNSLNPSSTPADGAYATNQKTKVLLIPYEPRLYMSGIDGKIAQSTGLSMYQIKNRMRFGLNLNVFAESEKSHPTISMLDSEDPEVQKDLNYIYNSIGYKYAAMPIEAEEEAQTPQNGVQKLAGMFTKGSGNETVEPKVEDNGAPQHNEPERFMNTTVINPNLFSYLTKRYEADYYLFINQLDITEQVSQGGYSYAKNSNMRRVKVHFTIFDAMGNEVYGGASIVYFPGKVNDLNGIINGYFPAVAANIAKHIPQPELSPAEEARRKEQEAQARAQREAIEGY